MISYVSETSWILVLDCARVLFCHQELTALYISVYLSNKIVNFVVHTGEVAKIRYHCNSRDLAAI